MSVSGSATSTLVADSSVYTGPAAMTRWTGPLLALVVGWLVTLFAFRETVASIARIWNGSSTYSYGFIIIPVCTLLIWRRKEDLRGLYPTSSLLGLAMFFVSTLIWVAGNVADVQLIQHIALVAMLDSLAWAFLGNAVVRTLRFPMFFLFLSGSGRRQLGANPPGVDSHVYSKRSPALRHSCVPGRRDIVDAFG